MADLGTEMVERAGTFAPLRHRLFRRIWTASVFSNFGSLIQSVGAAWAMTQLTARADMVALVQSATFAPLMICSLAAGAIADSYDRRKIVLIALAIALFGALGLTTVTFFDLLTPWMLLFFCFIVGTGSALLGPAWQSSVAEQVPAREVPQAIALNAISYNIARSFGPAVGGALVAIGGVLAAFAFNALAYLPLIAVMFLWRRQPDRSRLPPEALGRALISGVRYTLNSPPIRTVGLRVMVVAFGGSAVQALIPLVARQTLGGDVGLYGILLGCFGIGAISGALIIGRLQDRLSDEKALNISTLLLGLAIIVAGLSHHAVLTGVAMAIAGIGWMLSMALCNINVQMSSPRWVTGRALAAFNTAAFAGVAIGGWAWGVVAADHGTDVALIVAGVGLVASIALGFWMPMPSVEEQASPDTPLSDPEVKLDLTGRSGPIILSIEYRVPVEQARAFYAAMLPMEPIRKRAGGYGWSLSRDIEDPELWTERFHTPTWHDYLRLRMRLSVADNELWDRAMAFHIGKDPIRVRRRLERPYGSVRWSEDVPDRGTIVPLPSAGG